MQAVQCEERCGAERANEGSEREREYQRERQGRVKRDRERRKNASANACTVRESQRARRLKPRPQGRVLKEEEESTHTQSGEERRDERVHTRATQRTHAREQSAQRGGEAPPPSAERAQRGRATGAGAAVVVEGHPRIRIIKLGCRLVPAPGTLHHTHPAPITGAGTSHRRTQR